jgi:hypothetical protein
MLIIFFHAGLIFLISRFLQLVKVFSVTVLVLQANAKLVAGIGVFFYYVLLLSIILHFVCCS